MNGFYKEIFMTKKTRKRKSRYISVSYRGIKGIRQDTKSKTFLVEKSIRGERYSATFDTVREAADWKKNFHPSLNLSPLRSPQKSAALEKLDRPRCYVF